MRILGFIFLFVVSVCNVVSLKLTCYTVISIEWSNRPWTHDFHLSMLRAACSISLYSETYLILCILYLFSSHILESTQVRYTRHLTVPLDSDACCPVMIYISVSATRIGTITPELVFYFVAIVNATSLFGRWSAGVLADVIGTFLLLYFSFFYNLLSLLKIIS